MRSALAQFQINSSQLISFVPGIGRPFVCRVQGRAGAEWRCVEFELGRSVSSLLLPCFRMLGTGVDGLWHSAKCAA